MKPIKIVSYNTYLISSRFNKNRVTHPEQRASKIRRDLLSRSNEQGSNGKENDKNPKRPDLCFFQEVWGSGISELTKTVDFSVPPRRTSLISWPSSPPASPSFSKINYGTNQDNDVVAPFGSLFGTMKELLDTLYLHWQKTGGLYDFSHPSMVCRYRSKHTFTVSRSKSKKGVEATLWDIPLWRSGCNSNGDGNGGTHEKTKQGHKQLLVFNTHLDPWHVENRRKQICEIIYFIEDTLRSIENTVAPRAEEESKSSFETGDQLECNEYDWSQTGVLVVGDFNIKASSEEYWETLGFLKSMSITSSDNYGWKDYFFRQGETEDNSVDQHTYALENSLAVYPEDCGRIDYIFGIQRFQKPQESMHCETSRQSKTIRIFMPLKVVSRSVRKEPIGAESSDHYALVLELIPDL